MPVRQDGHLQDNTQMSKKILCRSCGAEYDGRETKCPWCGTRTDAGAEREYMKKLSDVKDDLEGLSDIPEQSFRRNAGKQIRQIRGILIFALILFLIPAGMLVSGELRERGRARKELAWERSFRGRGDWFEVGRGQGEVCRTPRTSP